MKEIEVRILDINRDALVQKILKNSGRFIDKYKIGDTYFEFEDNKLEKSKKRLRIRERNDQVFVTFKSKFKLKGFRVRDELETVISDASVMTKIFLGLGYKICSIRKKERIEYKLDNVIIVFDEYLDKYSFIPEYAEFESSDSQDIKDVLQLLGYSLEDTVSWGINKVIKYYKKCL